MLYQLNVLPLFYYKSNIFYKPKPMRRNAEKVSVLRTDIINDIKDYMSSKHLMQIEFKDMFTFQAEVASSLTDYDMGVEQLIAKWLTSDGFVIDTDGGEFNLDELSPYELAWVLDELEEGKYSITELKEN